MELLTFVRDSSLIDGNLTHSAQLTDLPNTVQLEDISLFEGYSSSLLTFASATCIVFILVGLPGNLITIIALARCKNVRNATAVFIINLSLSDLLFCCFNLPLAASTFWNRRWLYKYFACELFPLMRYGLLAVSLFTILAITINRYVMIGHPRIYPSYLLIYLTTCINPIIYVVMSSEYRQTYWNLLMCRTKSRGQKQKELVQKQGSQRT